MKLYKKLSLKYIPAAKLFAGLKYVYYSHKKFPKDMRAALTNFSDHYPHDNATVRKIKKDMIFSKLHYRINSDEYFRYKFMDLSDLGRKSFVANTEHRIRYSKIDNPEVYSLLKNKYSAYKYFKDYYKRDAIEVESDKDFESFSAFAAKHAKFIVKPLAEQGGEGVHLEKLDSAEDKKSCFERILKSAPCVVEELIVQDQAMAKFHPQSINTIRIISCMKKDKFSIVQTSMRIGLGDSVVDNGCLSCAVDTDTGIIITPGRNAHASGIFYYQPDTGEKIIGEKVPQWEELKALSKELHARISQQRVVGWDFALSDKGWIMVEANCHPAIQILAGNGMGMRKVFEEMMKN